MKVKKKEKVRYVIELTADEANALIYILDRRVNWASEPFGPLCCELWDLLEDQGLSGENPYPVDLTHCHCHD